MRLFIAFPLEQAVEQCLDKIIADLKSGDRNRAVKWVKADLIHLTAKFIGDTEKNLVEPIAAVIKEVTARFGKIVLPIDRIDGFPNLKRPRVIFVTGQNKPENLRQIASQIDEQMSALGFEREQRPFKAHLTLGRVRREASIGELADVLMQYKFEPFESVIDRLVLFKSTLTPRGPIYERLFESRLGEERFG